MCVLFFTFTSILQNLRILDWCEKADHILSIHRSILAAAEKGRFEALKWFDESTVRAVWPVTSACKSGNIEVTLHPSAFNILHLLHFQDTQTAKVIKWLVEIKCNLHSSITAALKRGHIQIAEYLFEQGADIGSGNKLVRKGNYFLLRPLSPVLHHRFFFILPSVICLLIISGNLKVLRWWCKKGGDPKTIRARKTINSGNLKFLKWLHVKGFVSSHVFIY